MKKYTQRRKAISVQQLESRRMFAGIVTIHDVGETIRAIGDNQANQVAIVSGTNSIIFSSVDGSTTFSHGGITGLLRLELLGLTPQLKPKSLDVRLKGGDDYVALGGKDNQLNAKSIEVKMGRGNDTVVARNVDAVAVTMFGGKHSDVFTVRSAAIDELELRGGRDPDYFNIYDVVVDAALLDLGRGPDYELDINNLDGNLSVPRA